MDGTDRCRSCGALLAADAAWCGQCYTPVAEPDPEPEPASPPPPSAATAPDAGATAAPFWPCSVCGGRNPIDADVCQVCGTPFAALMREEPRREPVPAREAVIRSLIFPGLGHRALGYPMDGVARGSLFAVSLAMAVLTGLAGAESGVGIVVFWLFLLSAIAVYVLSALEVRYIANGGTPVVAARLLMWVVAGEVFLAMAVLAISVMSASRR